jgi:hypothetical protein
MAGIESVKREEELVKEVTIVAEAAKEFLKLLQEFHIKYENEEEWVKSLVGVNMEMTTSLSEIEDVIDALQM